MSRKMPQMTENPFLLALPALFSSWSRAHASNRPKARTKKSRELLPYPCGLRNKRRNRALFIRGIFPLAAFVALSASAIGSEAGLWQLTARPEETDASGAVRFRQLQAQGPDGRSAEIWLAFAPVGQVRCRVIARSTRPFDSVRAAVEQSGSVAGVNGGYFKEDGSPVGLLVCAGRQVRPFEKARLLSGTFLVRAGRPYIQRTADAPRGPLDEAIQCGPLLVERGATVAGLNDERIAPRTFVFLTAQARVGIGIIRSATLTQAARLLVSPTLLPDDRIKVALNLDGGSSTGFFGQARGGSLDQPEWARVSDCLVFGRKKTIFR